MPLSIFIDALPHSEIEKCYSSWFKSMQFAILKPNIAYSSCLHWQLYCNKYPDERKKFVDWLKINENDDKVIKYANLFRPLDNFTFASFCVRKIFNKYILKNNSFAFIPFKFRKLFSNQAQYLFWDKNVYSKEENFKDYLVISQDENKKTFEKTFVEALEQIKNSKKIFINFGFADYIGHRCARGAEYDKRLKPYMERVKEIIQKYLEYYPNEEVIIMSDHGMSTINKKININLEKRFGKQSESTYIAYMDSCIMCVWSKDMNLLRKIKNYLETINYGHMLTEEERVYYKATDRLFGDIIFNLREGYVFKNSWFGQSKRRNKFGEGMHGFWPELEAVDQMAVIISINSNRQLKKVYDYSDAYKLVSSIMGGKCE